MARSQTRFKELLHSMRDRATDRDPCPRKLPATPPPLIEKLPGWVELSHGGDRINPRGRARLWAVIRTILVPHPLGPKQDGDSPGVSASEMLCRTSAACRRAQNVAARTGR